MRKWTLIFALLLAATPCLTALAGDATFETHVIDETIGIIDVCDLGFIHVSGEALTPGGFDSAIIQLGDAPAFDLLTGLPIALDSLERGMEVRVAYYQQPGHLPQAVTLWLHPNHEDAAVFTTIVSENIQYGLDYCVFLSADGRYRITLTTDTLIFDPSHGSMAPADIVPGQEFFVWVDMITASSPSLVYPDKVVLIG